MGPFTGGAKVYRAMGFNAGVSFVMLSFFHLFRINKYPPILNF